MMKIEFKNIRKSFGSTEVLHGIDLSVEGGRIYALLGENGAGKSTLMNILGGLLKPDAGNVFIDGAPVRFRAPADSLKSGIAFIHQELNPVNDLTVYENIFLGMEMRSFPGLPDRRSMRAHARALLDTIGISLDENQPMRELGASQKQVVEIARALLCRAKAIIMDEPTSSLTEQEISQIFRVVRKLRDEGAAVIFISHKLNEVKELCTDYAVLRNGSLAAKGKMDDVTVEELSAYIVGHELTEGPSHPEIAADDAREVLRADSLCREGVFRDVSFAVKKGEILGFTGLLGDGRSEVFRCIFGDETGFSGRLFLHGRPFKAKSTAAAVAAGIAYVPSNRKENAIVPDMSVLSNGTLATLRKYRKWIMLNANGQKKAFEKRAADLKVKHGGAFDLIGTLSGGNQQKVILARWLDTCPGLLVLDNPTQGVDIGARQEIYQIIHSIAAAGVAVVVLSGEGQEIVRLCNRALVMFHGRIAGELRGPELNEHGIMRLATGIGGE